MKEEINDLKITDLKNSIEAKCLERGIIIIGAGMSDFNAIEHTLRIVDNKKILVLPNDLSVDKLNDIDKLLDNDILNIRRNDNILKLENTLESIGNIE